MRLLNHHVSPATVLTVAYEYAAACASVYLAGYARFGTDWPASAETAPTLPEALLFGLFTVMGLAAMGLYQTDHRRLSKEAIVARIAVALTMTGIAETAVFFMWPSIAFGRGIWAYSLLF